MNHITIQNLTNVRNTTESSMSEDYKQGYADSINTTINITMYDKCAEYRNGYEDACRDIAAADANATSNLTTVSFSF